MIMGKSAEKALVQFSAEACTLYTPAAVTLRVTPVPVIMAAPFKYHWLPEVALLASVGASLFALLMVTVGLTGLMQKICSTGVAALKLALPAWLAIMVTRPAFSKVTWLPLILTLSEALV